MLQSYRRKPEVVQAVQYDGNPRNLITAVEIPGTRYDDVEPGVINLWIPGAPAPIRLAAGDFLVKPPTDHRGWKAYSAEHFEWGYLPLISNAEKEIADKIASRTADRDEIDEDEEEAAKA
jgi:hypothetical protein